MVVGGHAGKQDFREFDPEIVQRGAKAGQRRLQEFGARRLAKADDGDIATGNDASLHDTPIEADRHQLIDQDHSRRPVFQAKQFIGDLIATLFARFGADDQRRIIGDAMPLQCTAIAFYEDEAEIDVAGGRADGNATVPARDEAVDGAIGDAVEIQVGPRMLHAREAAAKRRERNFRLGEHIEALVDALRLGEDQRIDDAPCHHAFQIFVRVFVMRAGEHDQIEIVPREYALQAARHGQEEVVAILDRFPAGLDHQADDIRRALPQAASGLVGHIAELFCGREHALAGLFVHIRLAVQCA
ncbi:hypothetical protein RHSP_80700 [Rhizobium freirei PRF 81]|uniref:Uncharacterized protein n=1 Tax=Rhizobium freirei PRF 81 TaxID=363754 RepID=N6UHW2_9HYPH|nr:hypothetical protein RHSP_80700 [Rhizobium freirei PRF 81]